MPHRQSRPGGTYHAPGDGRASQEQSFVRWRRSVGSLSLTDVSCGPLFISHIVPTSHTAKSRPVRTTLKPAFSMLATTSAQMKKAAVNTWRWSKKRERGRMDRHSSPLA